MPELTDPPEAPEPGGGNTTKPRELVNRPVILQPFKIRTAHDKKKDEDFEVVDCHFWTLDRSGVDLAGDTGISWWRAREQLRECMGQYIACRPTQQDDNSITLERLGGDAREVAQKAIVELRPVISEEPPDYDDGGEDAF